MVEPIGTFRNTLRSARKGAGLEVSDVLYGMSIFDKPLSERSYRRYEYGQVYPPIDIAQVIAAILQTTTDALWPADLSKGD